MQQHFRALLALFLIAGCLACTPKEQAAKTPNEAPAAPVATKNDANANLPGNQEAQTGEDSFQAFTAQFPEIDLPAMYLDSDFRSAPKGKHITEQDARAFICEVPGSDWVCVEASGDDEIDYNTLNHYYAVGKIYGAYGEVTLLYQLYYSVYGILYHASYDKTGKLLARQAIAGNKPDEFIRNGKIISYDAYQVLETEFAFGALGNPQKIKLHRTAHHTLDPDAGWDAWEDVVKGAEALRRYQMEVPDAKSEAGSVAVSNTLPPSPAPNVNIEAALRTYYQVRIEKGRLEHKDSYFNYNLVNLDADAALEAVVQMAQFCGSGGCTLLVLDNAGESGFEVQSRMTLFRPPLYVLESRHHGWSDLAMRISGGGAQPGIVVLEHEGEAYPLNPSVAPAFPLQDNVKASEVLTGASAKDAPHFFIPN